MSNFYEILSVPTTATADEIKKAFRSIAQYAHPDKDPEGEHKELFEEASKARDILLNAQTRATYDLTGEILDGGETPQAVATSRVAMLINACYVAMCNKNNCQQNIVDFAMTSLQNDINGVETRISQLTEYKNRLSTEMAGRITVPEDMVNICENVCKQKIRELDASLEQGAQELDCFGLMKDILEHYTDSFGPRMVAPEFRIEAADPDEFEESPR